MSPATPPRPPASPPRPRRSWSKGPASWARPPALRSRPGWRQIRRCGSNPTRADGLYGGRRRARRGAGVGISPEAAPVAEVIAFANQKGGVGKTTTTVNLGAYLARNGQRVLIVDVDPQANASSGLGRDAGHGSLYDAIAGDAALSDLVVATDEPSLDLVPSSPDLA